jgi:hypothetical protein
LRISLTVGQLETSDQRFRIDPVAWAAEERLMTPPGDSISGKSRCSCLECCLAVLIHNRLLLFSSYRNIHNFNWSQKGIGIIVLRFWLRK